MRRKPRAKAPRVSAASRTPAPGRARAGDSVCKPLLEQASKHIAEAQAAIQAAIEQARQATKAGSAEVSSSSRSNKRTEKQADSAVEASVKAAMAAIDDASRTAERVVANANRVIQQSLAVVPRPLETPPPTPAVRSDDAPR